MSQVEYDWIFMNYLGKHKFGWFWRLEITILLSEFTSRNWINRNMTEVLWIFQRRRPETSLDGFEGWRLRFYYQSLLLECESSRIRLNANEFSMNTYINLSLDGLKRLILRFHYQNLPLEFESSGIRLKSPLTEW